MIDLSGLNPRQQEAVLCTQGPLLVLAGAGSGKTRVLTHRVAHLVDQGVPAWSILAITFTNKAAREMRERIEKLVGEGASEIWVSTFHSCCARILRRDIEKLGYRRAFSIYDSDDQMSLLREIVREMGLNDKLYAPREMGAIISDAKNKLLSPVEWASAREAAVSETDRHRVRKIAEIFERYQARLKANSALDFDDLLLKTIELLVEHAPVLEYYRRKFSYILVDEYQDTNMAQYKLVRLLTGEARNVCVVGDDDQSIYGWRGADIRNILEFEKDFPGCRVIKLEQNYRSTGTILTAANQVIAHNAGRKEKALWTELGEGEKIGLYCAGDERDEAAWLCGRVAALRRRGEQLGDIAVLYRANAQSRVIEEALVRSGIVYRVYGGMKFYERKEVKDLIAYLRAVVNPDDDVAVRRIINEPRRGIGESTVKALLEAAEADGSSLLNKALFVEEVALSARARAAVEQFGALMSGLIERHMTEDAPDAFLRHVIEVTGYEKQYEADSDENRARRENIAELETAVGEYLRVNPEGGLEGFLENVALVTDLDAMDEGQQALTLMTLHSAKGLEFGTVFLPGMEEGVFPTSRAMVDEDKLEEERRLCYVGITRARRRLLISCAASRALYGSRMFHQRSRFLDEIPARLIDEGDGAAERRLPAARAAERPRAAVRPAGATVRPAGAAARPSARADSLGIPGVARGAQAFAPSIARGMSAPALFQVGDAVRHGRYGEGRVARMYGEGREARMVIEFAGGKTMTFAVDVAPVIKISG